MNIEIYSIGKIKLPFIKEGEKEYLKRIDRSLKVDLIEIDCDKYSVLPETQMKEREAQAFLGRVDKDAYLVVLDGRGRKLSSEEFAGLLDRQLQSGRKSMCFAIGGASGWDAKVCKRADLVLSLSDMTFSHQLTRLVLVEQIYRAYTIVRGIPYHK